MLPSLHGARAASVLKPIVPTSTASNPTPPTTTVAQIRAATNASVISALAQAAANNLVPSNLEPSLEGAATDEARPFLDGCDDGFTDAAVRRCTYGATRSPIKVVMYGDSHAAQWFPPLDRIATARSWRLVFITKASCPPVQLQIWSPDLHRDYRECAQFHTNALGRIRAEHLSLVILDAARQYGPENHFTVYGADWNRGLTDTIARIRATGASVLVFGPIPKPNGSVPDCLSKHLLQVSSCARARNSAFKTAGAATERKAIEQAGSRYLDLSNWFCRRTTCPAIVGNLLLYRDDSHVTTTYATCLTPVLDVELNLAVSQAAQPRSP